MRAGVWEVGGWPVLPASLAADRAGKGRQGTGRTWTMAAPMHLVQLLLPLYDNAGQPFDPANHLPIRRDLTERFGGLTAYVRAPAAGSWKNGDLTIDDVVVYEVMVETLDRAWWAGYHETLRCEFRQDALVVRAQAIEVVPFRFPVQRSPVLPSAARMGADPTRARRWRG